MSIEVVHVTNRRGTFHGSAIAGRLPMTTEQRKSAPEVASEEVYRKMVQEKQYMRR